MNIYIHIGGRFDCLMVRQTLFRFSRNALTKPFVKHTISKLNTCVIYGFGTVLNYTGVKLALGKDRLNVRFRPFWYHSKLQRCQTNLPFCKCGIRFWCYSKLHRCQTKIGFDRLWIYIGVKKKTECATLYNGFDTIINYKGVKQVCCFYEYIDGFDILWNSLADLTAIKWDMMIMYHL